MKTINIIRTLILSGIIGICSSCIEDYKYEEVTGAPQVAFSTSETEFTKQSGSILSLKAIVIDGQDVKHEWKYDGEVCSESAELEYELTAVGTFKLEYTCTDIHGSANKTFTVNVKPGDIEGVVFSTDKSEFTKSVGESLRISVTVKGTDPVNHEWKVNGTVHSTTANFDYPITESGDYEIVYTITKKNQELKKTFKLTAIASEHGSNWFVWQDMKQYVICLKDDETKVVTHHNGGSQFVIETYNGSNDQKFMKGAYFGYSAGDTHLEYTNIYNVGTQMTINEKGAVVSADVTAPGNCAADGWRGWYFIIDEYANARMIHFLETWDYTATYTVAIKGCILRPSDDKRTVVPVFYDRCKIDGVRDHTDYNALEGQYYDFKIKAVEDM